MIDDLIVTIWLKKDRDRDRANNDCTILIPYR